MASLVRRGLAGEGIAADVAANGEDALWMAQAHAFDAIVLDVMLPGLGGFETCRRLRAAGVWAPVGLGEREPLERDGRLRPPPAPEDRRALRPRLARDRARRRLPAAGRGLVSRIPIRLRVTAAFALAMAAVLAGSGLFLYLRLG